MTGSNNTVSWAEEVDTSEGRSSSSSSSSATTTSTASKMDAEATPTSATSSRNSKASSSGVPIHQRLVRIHRHRDPLRYYEVKKLLGDGSMGSVSLVRKRTFGGSARQSFVEDEKKVNIKKSQDECSCKFAGCFNFCLPGAKKDSFVVVVEEDNNKTRSKKGNKSKNNNKELLDRERKIKGYGSKKKSSSMISFGTDVMIDFAMKTIILSECRNSVFKNEMKNEILVLRSLDHPNIVKPLEVYDYNHRIYLVLQLCSGGDLYVRDPYTEQEARKISFSLFDAIAYLHSKHITHRDLKYENIMFASAASTNVKIIDFGLSKKYGKDMNMNQLCGTTYTMAPEVLKGKYNQQCDIWSLGVITFMLVSSSIPFYGDTREEVTKQILKPKQWKFKARRWRGTSKEAKDFIRKLLVHDTTHRLSAIQALEHPWFKNCDDNLGDDSTEENAQINEGIMDRVLAAIQTFTLYSRLKKLALLIIAHQSIDEEKEIGFLRHLFLQRFDTEKANANVSYPEFKMALKGYNYSNEELTNMFNSININGTGKISFTEFLASTIESHGHLEEARIAEAFDRIDNDDSGYITVKNLQDIFGEEVAEGYLDEIIDEVNDEDDGHYRHVTYTQFLGLWDEDSDNKLRLSLMDVQQRRLLALEGKRNSFRITPSTSVGSSDDDVEYSDTKMDLDQSINAEASEIGRNLFEIEKAKSLRDLFDLTSTV